MSQPTAAKQPEQQFVQGLGLFDSTLVVIAVMIGSGIFIVSADMSRLIGSPGWMLMAWVLTGLLTVAAALSYGELAAMMPGGRHVHLPARGLLAFMGLSVWLDFLHRDSDRNHRGGSRRVRAFFFHRATRGG